MPRNPGFVKKKKKQKKNFGDKTQFFVDDIYKISYQDNGITSRFMTLHAYKHNHNNIQCLKITF